MKQSELIKILKKHGCFFQKHGGEHDIWIAANGRKLSVPRHSKEVSVGVTEKLLKSAGVK